MELLKEIGKMTFAVLSIVNVFHRKYACSRAEAAPIILRNVPIVLHFWKE